MVYEFIDASFVSLYINAARAENLFNQFTSCISRMTELNFMHIRYVVITMPYKLKINWQKNMYINNYKDTMKVMRYFLSSV